MIDLQAFLRNTEEAGRRFDEGVARLYRPDGTRTYSDEAHEERVAALRAERDAVLDGVIGACVSAREAAMSEARRLRDADPAESLTAEALARANAVRPFAADQAQTLNTRPLARRLRATLDGGDRAAVFAWLLAGEKRRASMLRAGQHTTPLDEVIGTMLRRFVLDGKPEAARESSRETECASISVEMRARALKTGSQNLGQAFARQQRVRAGARRGDW